MSSLPKGYEYAGSLFGDPPITSTTVEAKVVVDVPRQRSLFPVDVETRPLKVSVTVAFIRRSKRAKCSMCGMYRVVFVLQASSGEESSPICAKCAGIR